MLLCCSPVGLVGRFAGGGFYNPMVNSHSFSLLDTWDCNIPQCFPGVTVYSFFFLSLFRNRNVSENGSKNIALLLIWIRLW